jgi:uncharacterized membrane protein
MSRILIAGESWMTHSVHQKGFDSFTTTSYHEGVGPLRSALEQAGHEVDYMPNHEASVRFPATPDALAAWSAVILSDIGANTLLLHPDTFDRSVPTPDRLAAIAAYVAGGGGLVMIGGYLTFQGIDGRARWGGTAVEDVLPVTMLAGDDRVEVPSGAQPVVRITGHPIVEGLPSTWPALLGYNRVVPRAGSEVLVEVGADPLLVAGRHGDGRAVAFTSDCGPHWCPPPFVGWDGYATLWGQLATWVAR